MEKTKNYNNYEILSKELSSPLNQNAHLNDSPNNKNKGYARILRNYIKKKNNALKNLLSKRFKRWKKEAFKGIFYRKTIIVRISVSRDNILKNRLNSNTINVTQNSKDIKPKSEDKNLKYNYKKNKMDTKGNNINYIKWKNTNEITTPERKKEEFSIKPIDKVVYKNVNNPIFKTYNDAKQTIKPINSQTIQNAHKSHKYDKNLHYKKKNHNINQYKINYHKRPIPTLQTYGINNINNVSNNKQHNGYNTFTSPNIRKTQSFNGYSYIHSNPKSPIVNQNIRNKEKLTPYTTRKYININDHSYIHSIPRTPIVNQNIKNKEKLTPIATQKYINIRKNFSEAKLFDKNEGFRYTYTRNNDNKYTSVDNNRKNLTHKDQRDMYMKKKLENEKLKKGITTVIQHYLGVRERFDNYNLLTN